MSTVAELLFEIEKRELILPEFQRGFVWSREKVKVYIASIYKNYPTGHFLIWKTYSPPKYRGDGPEADAKYNRLILDGQQRLTALYTVFRGEPPPFFEGSTLYFRLFFNVVMEDFEYWQPVKMRNDHSWIEVTPFLKQGLEKFLLSLDEKPEDERDFYKTGRQFNNLIKLSMMGAYEYDLDIVPKGGKEMETDEVVKIFNLVNSSGMTLSKADLALAHIGASWPEVRESLRSTHNKVKQSGFNLTTLKGRELEFWVRALAAVATDSILLDGSFYKTEVDKIKEAWPKVERSAEYLVNVLKSDAYVDSSAQLTTPYVLLPLVKYLGDHGHAFHSEAEKSRFLHWFYTAQMWARYSGPLETNLQQDIKAISSRKPTDELTANIVLKTGRIDVQPKDLEGKGRTSPFFNLLYAASCSYSAVDWSNGLTLYTKNLGGKYAIEIHHIFPISRLYKEGGLDSNNRAHVARANAIANLVFLTKEANLQVLANLPSDYLPAVIRKYPSALKAQFVPENPDLWKIENYGAFLEERRKLIADGINEFMGSLLESHTLIQGLIGVEDLIHQGESAKMEFKSSLRWDRDLSQVNKVLEMTVLKTIGGFMNTEGGILLIGVDDSGDIIGIEDYYVTLPKPDRDGFELHLIHLLSSAIGKEQCLNASVSFHEIDSKDICMVQVARTSKATYVREGGEYKLYIRTGNQAQPLPMKEAVDYVLAHWPG